MIREQNNTDYDVLIVGAGPGGIFTAYELCQANRGLKIAVFECGNPLSARKCRSTAKRSKAASTVRPVQS